MFKSFHRFALAAALVACSSAFATMSPVEITLVPGLQFPSSDYTVTGLRLSLLLGNQQNMYGLDFGVLGNITQQNFNGLAISGLFNLTRGQTTVAGLQLAGVTNINKGKTNIYGLEATLGVNSLEAESMVVGIQLAPLANIAPFTKVCGAQIGIYNRALDVYGFQIGVVNYAKSVHGLQIGLLNFNETGLFYVAPVLNMGF